MPPTLLRYRKQHPTDVVLGVAYLILEKGYPVAAVAREAEISRPTVYRWIEQVRRHGEDLHEFTQYLRSAAEAVLELGKARPLPDEFVRNFLIAADTKPWLNVRWYLERRNEIQALIRCADKAS